MAALASDWLRRCWLRLWSNWTEFNETWQEARSQRFLQSLCFSGQSRTRWPPWPLIGCNIFHFSEIAERNSTKLDREQDLNVLYQVCVFRADRKNKMAFLASDWLKHFRLLWNHWTEFNQTWQEARSQCPLPSLCFSGQSENQDAALAYDLLSHFCLRLWNCWTEFNELDRKQDLNVYYQVCVFRANRKNKMACPGLWFAETFSNSPLKPLNRIQRNLTGSKFSMSITTFVLFGKTIWPPWPLIGWDIFDFSSETAERPATKLDRKKDLMSSTKIVFFGPIGKTRWPPWPIRQKGGTLYSGARYVALVASCYQKRKWIFEKKSDFCYTWSNDHIQHSTSVRKFRTIRWIF